MQLPAAAACFPHAYAAPSCMDNVMHARAQMPCGATGMAAGVCCGDVVNCGRCMGLVALGA